MNVTLANFKFCHFLCYCLHLKTSTLFFLSFFLVCVCLKIIVRFFFCKLGCRPKFAGPRTAYTIVLHRTIQNSSTVLIIFSLVHGLSGNGLPQTMRSEIFWVQFFLGSVIWTLLMQHCDVWLSTCHCCRLRGCDLFWQNRNIDEERDDSDAVIHGRRANSWGLFALLFISILLSIFW